MSGELDVVERLFLDVADIAKSTPDIAVKRVVSGIREFALERIPSLAARGANPGELRRLLVAMLVSLSNCPVRDRLVSEHAFADFRSWLDIPCPPPPDLVGGFVKALLAQRPPPSPSRPAKQSLEAFRASFSRRDLFLQRLGASFGVLRAVAGLAVTRPLAAFRLARDLVLAARNGLFDRAFYVWSYPDVTARRFASPLLHYCVHGWREGRMFAPSVPSIPPDELPPRANPLLLHARLFPGRKPTRNTVRILWRELRPDLWKKTVQGRFRAETASKPPLAVVVPVHGHPELLSPLVASLLEHTPPDVLLVFVDDASPEAEVRAFLHGLAAEHPGRVRVECLETNHGFAGACNHGIRAAGRRDVILLNSDTEVGPRWSDSLRLAAYAEERIGTATAVSDNSWFASVPEEGKNGMPPGLDAAETARGWLHAPEIAFDQHTGHGFCLYLRRDMLDDVGLFDEKTFGKGYGEEIDLCLRAWEGGWKHRITTRAFVRHLHGVSFGALHRAFRVEITSHELQVRHPEFGELKRLHRPLWNARRPAFRLIDGHLRAWDSPRPLPRILVMSSDPLPADCEPFVLDCGDSEWTLRDRSRAALVEDGPDGMVVERFSLAGVSPGQADDAVVSWILEYGIERVVADGFLSSRPSLSSRLAALHVAVGGVPPPRASSAPSVPSVSVIVPIYNVRRWLPRCLDALCGQTLRDIEIVCVDDGSTDGSDAILRRYAGKDSRIVAVYSEHHGVEWSRSLAMERATGKYVMFCDPDDEYAPSMCATMAGAMERLGVDLAICSARHEGSFTEKEKRRRHRPDVDCVPVEIRGRDDVLWNKIFRRDLIVSSGLRFPRHPGIRRGFDACFCFCYQLVAKTAATLSSRLYLHRRRSGSLADRWKHHGMASSLDAVHALPLVFAFAEANHLPRGKSAQLLPWCDGILSEAVPSMNDNEREAGIRTLRAFFVPKAHLIGRGTPWLRAIADDDRDALAALLAERAAAGSPPPRTGLRSRFHGWAALLARHVPVLGPHLRAVDACLKALRRAQRERDSAAKWSAVHFRRLQTAEKTIRDMLEESAASGPAGTTGRGADVPGAVVVTFTSYPARIRLAAAAAASLLRQDAKPDAVVLWLDEAEFPRHDADFPPVFDGLRRRGLEIRWCRPGLRSYKKLVPALEAWPEANLVTADDDIFYPRDWLGGLLGAKQKHPGDILAYRVRRIAFDRIGRPLPYDRWPLNKADGAEIPSSRRLPTTGGGVLFPPGSLHPDATDEETFLRVAPTADDLWFWAMAVRNGTFVRPLVSAASKIQSLDSAVEFGPETLYSVNSRGANDRQFFALLNEFPELLRTETD